MARIIGAVGALRDDAFRILDIFSYRDAAANLDEDEKGVAITDTVGGRQEMLIVSEPASTISAGAATREG